MQHAARAMVAFAVAAFVVAVAVPAGALLGLLRLGGEVPETFDGARTLTTTLGWSIACAAAACALGWAVGRAMRSARGGHVLRTLSVVAAVLPLGALLLALWLLDRTDRTPLWVVLLTALWGAVGGAGPKKHRGNS